MKKIEFLKDMYNDSYYPTFLVDKLKGLLQEIVLYLEEAERTIEEVQTKLDEIILKTNDLQEEFWDNNSEIETVARDSIATTVEEILDYFEIELDLEEALRERDW
ncbi:DUF5713 family protein [Heyndrickxia sporothermodurans]